jgi:glycosyltransferase involved in cell wall biosynthesis
MKRTTAIICVYNEEKTIKNVVLSVSKDPNINEIIIVNDGSSYNTKRIIEDLNITCKIQKIHFQENKGKGYAMAVGVEHAKNEIIAFIDADQTKIISGYINQMTLPLINNESDMVLGYSTINVLNQNINPLRILTGERAVYKKDMLPILDKMKESRFGVETLLYFYFLSQGKTIKFTRLIGLAHKDKYKKMPFTKATTSYISEGWEIAYTAMKNYDLLLKSANKSIQKN